MNYINGDWCEGRGSSFGSINPNTRETIWEGRFASLQQLDDCAAYAKKNFLAWSGLTLESRLKIISKFYTLLEDNKDTLSNLISLETGKILKDAESEVIASISKFKNSLIGYQSRTGKKSQKHSEYSSALSHHPHGVIAVIGPFNFPLHLPNGHITPALIAGNSVIFKPSEHTPLVSEYLTLLWHEAGIPPGIFNLIHGSKKIVMNLCKHRNVSGVFFTGGYLAGSNIAQFMSKYPEKILALELGGNNPIVIWSTRKINKVVDLIFESAFITTGQRCTSARRLIIKDSVFGKRLVIALKKKINSLKSLTTLKKIYGPLISEQAQKNFLFQQQSLIDLGGKPVLKSRAFKNSNFVTPGLINSTNLSKKYDHEIFGPLIQIIFVEDFNSAIKVANQTKFGLAASLISDNFKLFEKFREEIRAGVVNFNSTTTGASGAMPFGGIGGSGNHRPAGLYAADFCAWPKSSLIKKL